MKCHDFTLSAKSRDALASHVGDTLASYGVNEPDNTSFEIFTLRFKNEDVEVRADEIQGCGDWSDDAFIVEAEGKPSRDSWSRLGESKPYDGIPAGTFRHVAVGATIKGISVAVTKISHLNDDHADGEYVRAILLHLDGDVLVFDKSEYWWSDTWTVSRTASSSVSFRDAESPNGFTNIKLSTHIERIA